MKRISIVLLAVAMLFAFASCDNSTPTDVSKVYAYSEDQLVAYMSNSAVKSVTIVGEITLSAPVDITADGFELVGAEGSKLTISHDDELIQENGNASGMIDVKADNVSIRNIDIEIPADSALINIIYTNNTGLTVADSSFAWLGEVADYDSVAQSKINQAICIDSNGSASIIGTSFRNAVTPVYASSPDVKVDNCRFNSGIEFETISEASAVVNCSPVGEGEVLGTAKVGVWYGEASATAPTEEAAKAFLDSVSGDDIITRLWNGSDYTEYPAAAGDAQ